ncbi:hypothetical protein PSTG_02125 [Puccinia striiformis f. sp. tritici PST-78]|uniref:Uncharacterized protein n=1 Tax=Puccinia striiformis f. sp. tritici PST-78 TaxID=1165861 RepID=A0A0L0VZF1_9BASI|nr:hypothetical protein PSTG_02125 [Puccinia striiformis f. sp. tritici PST-78]
MHSFLSHKVTYLNVKSLFVTGPTDSANKQSVHQLADDISQRANLIDPPSIRHSVNSLEFSLDHHQSRTSEDKTQTRDSYTSQSNKRIELNLFDRITLPPSGKVIKSRILSYFKRIINVMVMTTNSSYHYLCLDNDHHM